MKKAIYSSITAFILAVALLGLAACGNPVQSQFQDPGKGKVIVNLGQNPRNRLVKELKSNGSHIVADQFDL